MRKFFLKFMTIVLVTGFVMISCEKKIELPTSIQPEPSEGEESATDWAAQGYKVFDASNLSLSESPMAGMAQIRWGNRTDILTLTLGIGIDEDIILPEGVYTMDSTGYISESTWPLGGSTYYSIMKKTTYYLADGTIEVSKKGRQYTILTKCINTNGDSIKYAYEGLIELKKPEYLNEQYYLEEKTEEQSLTFDGGAISGFFGDAFETGKGVYQLILFDKTGLTWSSLYLVGDNTSTASEITPGMYTTRTDFQKEMTIIPGGFIGEYAYESGDLMDGFIPSYLIIDEGRLVYYIAGGSFNVSIDERNAYGRNINSYTINGTLKSALGTNISVSFSDTIGIIDRTLSESEASVNAVKPINFDKIRKQSSVEELQFRSPFIRKK